MIEKKMGTKFTILFSQTNPVHIQAVDILNRQPQRGKAHYIANAILHYENHSEMQSPVHIDEDSIKAVVKKILAEMQMSGASSLPVSVPVSKAERQSNPVLKHSYEIDYDAITFEAAMESLGEDGLQAVAGALDMFRRK